MQQRTDELENALLITENELASAKAQLGWVIARKLPKKARH